MATPEISRDSVVVACEGNISYDLAGEAAVLDFKSGMYYGLDEVGARIWKLIAELRTVGEICDVILAEYDVEPDVCSANLPPRASYKPRARRPPVDSLGRSRWC